MKKMGLICINNSIGMNLMLDSYTQYLSKYFNLFVITNSSYSAVIKKIKYYKIIKPLSNILSGLSILNPLLWQRIFRVFLYESPDIIFIISSNVLNPLFIYISRNVNKSIIVVSHIHDVRAHKGVKYEYLINLVQRIQIVRSDYFTVFGRTMKKMLSQLFTIDKNRILATPHGVSRLRIQDNKKIIRMPKVCFVGRIDKYKDIPTFLKIAKIFQEKNSHIQFHLAGSGDLSIYNGEIKILNNIKVDNKLLTNEEIDDIFKTSMVSLLPYMDASQSGVIPIAYYNSCPVIATNVGGLPEFIDHGNTGYIVNRDDIDSMVMFIDKIINDQSLLSTMENNCYNYYNNNLRYDKIIKYISKNIYLWLE